MKDFIFNRENLKAEEMASNMFYSFLSSSPYKRMDDKDIAKKSCEYTINLIICVINDSMLYKQSKRDFWEEVKFHIENF